MSLGRRCFFGGCVGFLIFFVFLWYLTSAPSKYDGREMFVAEKNDPEYIASLFVEKRISQFPSVIKILIKIMKRRGDFIVIGEYNLPNKVSPIDALKILASGKVVVRKICIPEGFSVFQVIERLNANKYLHGEIERIPDEGTIMPATYEFTYTTTRQQILDMAQKEMQQFLQKEWPKRSKNCLLKTPKEALILASIVEKEAHYAEEHKLIAGVYQHRLQTNMKLQACPSVIYAHKRGDKMGRPLLYRDLKLNDPYNTYVKHGLPPGPIANPGKACILAVLHPEKTDYLFFVADNSSHHVFSKTYKEHLYKIKKIKEDKKLKNN